MPLSPPSHLPGMTSRPASQTWTQWLSEVSRGQSPQPKQSLRHDTNTHPRLQNGVVSRAPGALGPGHPEQGPEGEGTVVGTSWGSGADGRPGEARAASRPALCATAPGRRAGQRVGTSLCTSPPLGGGCKLYAEASGPLDLPHL